MPVTGGGAGRGEQRGWGEAGEAAWRETRFRVEDAADSACLDKNP